MDNTDRVRLTAQQTIDELFADEVTQCRLIDAGAPASRKVLIMGILTSV